MKPRRLRQLHITGFSLKAITGFVCSFGLGLVWYVSVELSGVNIVSLPGATSPVAFVTFAFTSGAGGRWNSERCRRALRLMYSSLVKSQSEFPRLHVYTDDLSVIPNITTLGTKTDIVEHITMPEMLPPNAYTGTNPWLSLSRAKLDVVESISVQTGASVIWIDLDTLVFVDLSLTRTHSWIIGYQHGNCHNCSLEHVSKGGSFDLSLQPKFDIFGDLWALNISAIAAFRRYEKTHVSRGLSLPRFDLQGYFSLMLQENALPASFLHDIIDYNFGFVCSGFEHPTPANMKLDVVDGTLSCRVEKALENELSRKVGSVSFTAPTFAKTVLSSPEGDFNWIENKEARDWLDTWFHKIAK